MRKSSIRSKEMVDRIAEFTTHPVETLNKAKLFDEKVLEGEGKIGDKVINVLLHDEF